MGNRSVPGVPHLPAHWQAGLAAALLECSWRREASEGCSMISPTPDGVTWAESFDRLVGRPQRRIDEWRRPALWVGFGRTRRKICFRSQQLWIADQQLWVSSQRLWAQPLPACWSTLKLASAAEPLAHPVLRALIRRRAIEFVSRVVSLAASTRRSKRSPPLALTRVSSGESERVW